MLSIIISCAPKNKGWVCGNDCMMSDSATWIDSGISTYKTIGIADNNITNISGLITGLIRDSSKECLSNLAYINVMYKLSTESEYISGSFSDTLGKYYLPLAPGKYDLEFAFVGYNFLQVSDVVLSSGENKLLNIQLGEGYGKNEYVILSNGELKKLK